ncbi:MAG: amidinotransferase, partial [Rhodothermia bacterium]|nr:amidinotransferase [Rhodothermia bacterium]
MVFCANQALPFFKPIDREKGVVLSHMYAPQRAPEVPYYSSFFGEIGYQVCSLPDSVGDFEGMGDALWHTGRFLLWGGHGFRSSIAAYSALRDMLDVHILLLELKDPDFYHLDTCLSVLDEDTALVYPGAFDRDGLDLIHTVFRRVLYAPEEEARSAFAVNAHCPDGHNVIIQAGCNQTISTLRREGYNPIEVRTDEFLKAGGSVFCMKQMFW